MAKRSQSRQSKPAPKCGKSDRSPSQELASELVPDVERPNQDSRRSGVRSGRDCGRPGTS